MAVNIKQRLLTAGIMIPIVILCATNRWGWVLLNMGFPILVMLEYSMIMEKILQYLFVNPKNENSKSSQLYQKLIKRVNNKYSSCIYLIVIHVLMQTFDFGFFAYGVGQLFVIIAAVKLYVYCNFMQYPSKQDQATMQDDTFIRQAMVITAFSLLLEFFGHLYISLVTSLGYIFYFIGAKFIAISMCLSWQADNGGLLFGSLFGKTAFAQGISPKKTREGIIGAVFLCVLSAMTMWLLTHYIIDINLYLPLSFKAYCVIGISNAVHSIFSDLLESFFKRCAGVKDSSAILPGHGGFFDRIDSILLPIPFLLWYAINFLPEFVNLKALEPAFNVESLFK